MHSKKEKDNTDYKKIKEKISKIIDPILLKEGGYNHRMVGSEPKISKITFLWQPHNYRLYFDFNKENFNPKKPPNHTLQKYKSMVGIFNTAYTYTPLNYDKEHKYERFMFCTIRIKKTQVEIINHYHQKQWRQITADSIEEIEQRIDAVMNDLKKQSIEALKSFIDLHGGKSNFKILNERCEHGIHGDDYLDKIPRELIIHDTYIKKSYKKKVEFLTTPAIKNYVSNRAVEKIAPDIAESINKTYFFFEKMYGLMEKQTNNLSFMAKNQESHAKAIKELHKMAKQINNMLSQRKLKEYF